MRSFKLLAVLALGVLIASPPARASDPEPVVPHCSVTSEQRLAVTQPEAVVMLAFRVQQECPSAFVLDYAVSGVQVAPAVLPTRPPVLLAPKPVVTSPPPDTIIRTERSPTQQKRPPRRNIPSPLRTWTL